MPTVLISQCLQRDFVAPLEPHEPLPNALHVGADEARRLLGADPEHGPLAQLMGWARKAADDGMHIVHIRDHHDPDDPRQAEHLRRFGPHCLRGTRGAELVLDLETTLGPNEVMVDAIGLNDFEETALPEVLARIAATAPCEPLRIGLIGVWTDAKVMFLLYDLRTRLAGAELATSSALTASASRAAHFAALDQITRLLGVRVCDGVADFARFLVPDGAAVEPTRLPTTAMPPMECDPPERAPTGADATLVGYLHRQAARVRLQPLSGGFSGAAVYRVQAWDNLGHELAPGVVKVGPSTLVAKERVAFEQVEGVLGNHAPTVRGFADLGERAAIRYAFASMGSGAVRTFKALYESGADDAQIAYTLDQAFEVVLGRFQAVAQYERLPLLDYYGFASRWAPNVSERVAAICGASPNASEICMPDGSIRASVAGFYERIETLPRPPGESHYVSWVHGDLNGANILVDARDNIWVIDFFHAHRGHSLRDLAKLENDILYLMTPIADDDALVEHVRMTDQLCGIRDLRAALPARPDGVSAPALLRAWTTIAHLRRLGAAFAREDRDPYQLRVPLLRYAVHTLSFDEASPLQKRAALAAACGLAQAVAIDLERNRSLRIDDVAQRFAPGRLGVTLCPGRRDKGRVLADDMAAMMRWGAAHFVTFVTDDELQWAGVADLAATVRAAGTAVLRLPIPDQKVPTLDEAAALVADVSAALRRGENVVMACMGGLGRSGMMAACVLVALGASPADAIAAVRDARGPRAIETAAQEQFVAAFATR
jgi:protein-tyrosine phosphatase/nicotinamidase-related amidase